MPIHVHAEQFDSHLHAACGRYDSKVRGEPDPRVIGEDEFARLPSWRRCFYCTRINWPHGGAPR